MASRTANSLAACVTRYKQEAAKKEELMVRLFVEEGASLADIKAILERGGLPMSRSGILGVLRRNGVDTGRIPA